MDKILINSAATVTLNTSVGPLTLYGHNAITKITNEQLDALFKLKDFKLWVNKGYILVDAPLLRTDDLKNAAIESAQDKQEKEAASIKLNALTQAIMQNEGVTKEKEAEAEARKRLAMEADKAEQAGDDDATDLKKAARAKKQK